VELRRQEGYMSEFSADATASPGAMSEYAAPWAALRAVPQILRPGIGSKIRHTFLIASIRAVHLAPEGRALLRLPSHPGKGRAGPANPVHQD